MVFEDSTPAERRWDTMVERQREAVSIFREGAPSDRVRDWAARFQRRGNADVRQPDPVVDMVAHWAGPRGSVLDIGAGTGRTTIPLASRVGRITALEPSDAMRTSLQENIQRHNLPNVTVRSERWPEVAAQLGTFDVVLACHVVYFVAPIRLFLRAMEAAARKRVVVTVRVDSIRSGALTALWQELTDDSSPQREGLFEDFYPILLERRMAADVHIHRRNMGPRQFVSVEDAVTTAARLMGLDAQNPRLRQAVIDRLQPVDNHLEWRNAKPLREAVVSWEPSGGV